MLIQYIFKSIFYKDQEELHIIDGSSIIFENNILIKYACTWIVMLLHLKVKSIVNFLQIFCPKNAL